VNTIRFIDRESELRELADLEAHSRKKLFVVALYGLRRVGKTRLLLEFTKGRGLYFFVNRNKTSSDLLIEFQGILRENKVISTLEVLDSWDKFAEVLISRNSPPVIFDEFQNFRFVEPSIFGILQKNIDLNEEKPGLIVFAGSLIGLMKNLFRGSKEPLYGRVKKGMKLEPFGFSACLQLGRELGLEKEDLVKIYCIFGGFPRYYVSIEDFGLQGRKAEDIVDFFLLAKDAPLEDEVNGILAQEFGGRSGTYYSILEAIATGNNALSSIACCMGAQATSITRQINELRNYFELIEFEKPYSGKRGIYRIRHPLIDFWFSSIYRNYSDYAARKPEFVESFKKNLNTVYGKAFERAAKEFLVSELDLTEASRQWGKVAGAEKGRNAYEIDLIGKSREATFAFEFKWKDLEPGEAAGILKDLRGKAVNVRGLPPSVKFGIVAKKIGEKQEIRSAGYLAYDIDDFR
jgi:hypothetical protein